MMLLLFHLFVIILHYINGKIAVDILVNDDDCLLRVLANISCELLKSIN